MYLFIYIDCFCSEEFLHCYYFYCISTIVFYDLPKGNLLCSITFQEFWIKPIFLIHGFYAFLMNFQIVKRSFILMSNFLSTEPGYISSLPNLEIELMNPRWTLPVRFTHWTISSSQCLLHQCLSCSVQWPPLLGAFIHQDT